MTTDTNPADREHRERKVKYVGAASAPMYGFGFIGALGALISFLRGR